MSKQHLTLSKGRSSTKNSFDIVAVLATKSNVASTLLLVWTGFIGEASELTGRRERRWRAGQGSSDCAATPTTAELRWCRRWRRRRSREEERYRALAAYPATASLESASLHTKYTVLRKKRDALFFTMTPALFGGLYTFLHRWKQERTFYRKVINFNLILCLQFGNVICSSGDRGRPLPAVAFDRTGCAQLWQKAVQCSSFQFFFFGNSSMSLRAKNRLDSRKFW